VSISSLDLRFTVIRIQTRMWARFYLIPSGEHALPEIIGIGSRLIRNWPHIRLSPRLVLFEIEKVISSLASLEVCCNGDEF
jgi:hypothetical protein